VIATPGGAVLVVPDVVVVPDDGMLSDWDDVDELLDDEVAPVSALAGATTPTTAPPRGQART
jgi:hypothetical protein